MNIFILVCIYKSTWFIFIYNYSITNHIAPYNLYRHLGLISEDLSIPRIITCLLWELDSLSTCYIQVPLSEKLHPCGDATSKPYKPTFHGGHLSCNTSYGGAATLWIFHLQWQRYSYSTQSSMMELLLSVSQHWNLRLGQQGFYHWNPDHLLLYQFVYKTSSYTVIR